jgi:hypothetical protein
VIHGASAALPRSLRSGLLALALSVPAAALHAVEVKVPLNFDYALMRQLLMEQVYTAPNRTARVWDDGMDCNLLILTDPAIGPEAGRIRIASMAEAKVGEVKDGHCSSLLQWQGSLLLKAQPVLAKGLSAVRFHVVDSELRDREGDRPIVTGTLWDWTKTYVHPRLESLTLDLQSPLRELRSAVALMFPREDLDSIRSALDSLVISEVRAGQEELTVVLQFNVPEMTGPPPPLPPEPVLTTEELQKWEAAADRWDAFLTFVILQIAKDTEARELRQTLLGVLLGGRYDLTEALTGWSVGSPDPVRGLFVKSWHRLAPVLRRLSSAPGARAARYLGFIAAGDALEALDQVGAQLGFEISADGLRQLARTIAPQYPADPLGYTVDVDTELRRVFGFGPPLPLPEIAPDTPDTEQPGAGFLIPSAWAATGPDGELVRKLNRWIPERDEIPAYLPLVRDMLKQTATAVLAGGRLDRKFHGIFGSLSLATAWQESCWRQFVKQRGETKPLTSAAGAVGIMQVNWRVWRGFYDRQALRQDIAYNAAAGNEILLHYLVDEVMEEIKVAAGDIDAMVRATYAVYNGGPGQLGRFLEKRKGRAFSPADHAFWAKYQQLLGDELAVARCFDVRTPPVASASPGRIEAGGALPQASLAGAPKADLQRHEALFND